LNSISVSAQQNATIDMRLTARRAVIVLAAGAAIGFSIFGVLVYRAVTIEQAAA
jgi:hypothetical protein